MVLAGDRYQPPPTGIEETHDEHLRQTLAHSRVATRAIEVRHRSLAAPRSCTRVDGPDLELRRGVRDPPAAVTLPLEAGRIPT
jgi:hypothetical protein